MKMNNKKVKRNKGIPVYSTPNPNGTRHERRNEIALKRKEPQFDIKAKINRNIKDTKETGRKAKYKHIDEVKKRTELRKKLKQDEKNTIQK